MSMKSTCEAVTEVVKVNTVPAYCRMKPPDIPHWFNQTLANQLRNTSCWRLYHKYCVPPFKGQTQENQHTTTAVTVVGLLLLVGLVVIIVVLNRRWRFGYIVTSIIRKRLNKNKVNNDGISRQSTQCSYRMDTPEVE